MYYFFFTKQSVCVMYCYEFYFFRNLTTNISFVFQMYMSFVCTTIRGLLMLR